MKGDTIYLDAFGAFQRGEKLTLDDIVLYHADCMIVRVEEEIREGETDRVEFKASTRNFEGKRDKELEKRIVKSICGFLNKDGGKLLIGVDDASNVVGLEKVYKTLGNRSSQDRFRRHLSTIIKNWIGKSYFWYLKTDFHKIDGRDISETVVTKSSEPVYTKKRKGKKFWVRNETSTETLSFSEAEKYIQHRFTTKKI